MRKDILDKAVDTIISTCINYKMGEIDEETLIATLNIYAEQMKELIEPYKVITIS
jgi:hypothetical protein